MSPVVMLLCVAAYFAALLGIAWWTGRQAGNEGYFIGNRRSPWLAVAVGLISDSLSGVTFISVPGQVQAQQFAYLQVVLGYLAGYVVIAQVLLPLYYRLRLTSIYSFLGGRFGPPAQMTGSFYFLLSRLLGAAARLYLAASVIQLFIFDRWRVPFWGSTLCIIALILVYTYRGGIKTLVWTDVFQSCFLVLGVILSIAIITRELGLGWGELLANAWEGPHSRVFFWDWRDRNYFWKQFIGGAFIALVMTGLDQNSMQKNLSCRSLAAAQKNLYTFSVVMVVVNVFFLTLGSLLYTYLAARGLPAPDKADLLFPTLALHQLGAFAAVVFLVGLTAATFSSADSVLTTLTTSFCIDFLRIDESSKWTDAQRTRLRHAAHIGFAVLLFAVILVFRTFNSDTIITVVLKLATYTYGPLLGLFAFGLIFRANVRGRWVPLVCLVPPVACYFLDQNSTRWLGGYQMGFELLVLNGLLTAAGLWLIRLPQDKTPAEPAPVSSYPSHS